MRQSCWLSDIQLQRRKDKHVVRYPNMKEFCRELPRQIIMFLSVSSQAAKGRNSRNAKWKINKGRIRTWKKRSTWNYVRSSINYNIQMFPPNWWLCIFYRSFSGRDLEFFNLEIGILGGGLQILHKFVFSETTERSVGTIKESLGS